MTTRIAAGKRIAFLILAIALTGMMPAVAAHAQTNTSEVSAPSTNSDTASTTHAGHHNGNGGMHAGHNADEHPKKKKHSFMNKMRDKAMAKVQKLFGPKQQTQGSKASSNTE